MNNNGLHKAVVCFGVAIACLMKMSTAAGQIIPPSITSISPAQGVIGDTITINGSGFSTTPSANAVGFNKSTTSATVTSATSKVLTVIVPADAQTGGITVSTSKGSATSSPFTILAATVTGISPSNRTGAVGQPVTLSGTNFSIDPTEEFLVFNGKVAVVTSSNHTSLTGNIPNGATTGPLTLVIGTQSISAGTFTVASSSAPNAPVSVTVPSSSSSPTFSVSWTPSSTGAAATSFTLQQATSASGPWTVVSSTIAANQTSYSVTVPSDGTYYYEVAACNTSCSSFTISGAIVVTTLPNAPSVGVPASSSSASIPVSWTPSGTGGSATSFQVYRATSASGPWGSPIATLDAAARSYSDTVPSSGTYYYRVGACNVSGCAYGVSSSVVVTLPVSPNAPTSVTVPASSSSSTFSVSWAPSSTGAAATSFTLQQATSSSGPWTLVSSTIAANQTSYSVTVPSDGTYYYEVAACNTSCSSYTVSGAIVVTTSPNAPSVSVPATGSSSSIPVSWTPSGTGGSATSFQVYRATSAGGPWGSSIATLGAAARGYTDTVPGNGTYYYQVGACNVSCAYGVSSSVVVTLSASLPTPPSLPPAATPVNDLPTHDASVGTMAGQAGTDGGAATYTIPIVVPPGRAGMQPSLSLNYNSRSGNGVMGVGWTISGLSSIHRCPQTMEQDGQTLGVALGSSDKLCLDGQRIVAIAGIYGASGTEYRTEVDSYARIIQTGGSLTGATTCFRVEQKDGRIFHYGAVTNGSPTPTGCATSTANARVQPGGAGATLSWLLEKIEDRVGNNQLYAYTAVGNGENLISTVMYTGFGTTAGDRVVKFNYETRAIASSTSSDLASSYLAGGMTMQTQALASIVTSVAASTVRTYTPAFTTAAYSSRLLMSSMTECATNSSGTNCHPATQFSYNDGALSFPLTSLSGAALPSSTSGINPYQVNVIGDLDGDGTREAAVSETQADGIHVYLVQTKGDRTVTNALDLSSIGFSTDPARYAEIDGSGRSALIAPPASSGVPQVISFGIWNWNLFARGTVATSNPLQIFASTIPYTFGAGTGSSGAIYAADVNGDGKTDIIVTAPTAACGSDTYGSKNGVFVYINKMSGQLETQIASNMFQIPSGPLFCLTRTTGVSSFQEQRIDHIADFDGNGLPDFYLVSIDSLSGSTTFAGVNLTNSGGSSVTPKSCTQIGLISDGTNMDDECNWYNGYSTHWLDVNGDGLEDFVIARANQGTWQVRLNQGNGLLGSVITPSGAATFGLDNYVSSTGSGHAFRYANSLPTMDVDADGKPEILVPSHTQGVNGFAMKVCTMTKVSPLSSGGCPLVSGAMAPVGGNAPAVEVCPAYSCAEDPGSTTAFLPGNTGQANYPYTWNGQPAFGSYNGAAQHGAPDDNSIYHLAMLKFVQTGTNALRIDVVETPLVSRLNGALSHTDDLFGDGLQDLVTNIGCANIQVTNGVWTYPACSVVTTASGITYGPTTLPDAAGTPTTNFATSAVLYVNLNQGPASGGTFAKSSKPFGALAMQAAKSAAVALAPLPQIPGLMSQAANGLQDTATWTHFPLSYPITVGGLALYTVPGKSGYVDSRHYYFESSMPVVIQMTQSSGTGLVTGIRNAIYGYAEAMYNHMGRGFQGFHTVTSISGDNVNGTDRFTRTATTFNQKFPLVGKIASRTTSTQDASGNLHQVKVESDQWICTRNNRAVCPQDDTLPTPTATTNTSSGTPAYQPLLDTQSVKTYDPGTGTQMAQVDTTNATSVAATTSGWDNYSCGSGSLPFGNLNNQIVTTSDMVSNIFVTSHTAQTQTCYDTTGSGSWWVNKVVSNTVTSSIVYASGHALPSGTSAPSQSVSTAFSYNLDRTPLTKSVQSGIVNQQSTTTYCYPGSAIPCPSVAAPSYGLPTQVSINAPDLPAAQSPTRMTSYTYTKNGTSAAGDGYFVLGTTNALNQLSTTYHQASDGQVTTTIDPNSVQILTIYDSFGRATQISHLGNTGVAFESPVKIAYTWCSGGTTCAAGLVGEDNYETNSAYRVTTVQDGFPTKVTWFDLLGRPIKSAEAVYTGVSGGALAYRFSATSTIYDQNGTVAYQYEPYFVGTTPAYITSFDYDALNRPVVKVEPRSELDSLHGDLETDYSYNGRQTNIVAHATSVVPTGGACPTTSTTNLCLQMTRSTNALGQLMQTTELPVLVTGTRHALATNYWTEPQGRVVAMKDTEGNITSASYNQLGQRTQSVDPDQGVWNFQYDALGELLTQTDARGATMTVTGIDALGRLLTRQSTSPLPLPLGMTNEVTWDQWIYDQSGIGLLSDNVRRRGTLSPPSSNPIVWERSYQNEPTTVRPFRNWTYVIEGSLGMHQAESETDYDAYGRVSSHLYPSGLTVQHTYTAYGQLDALSNASTGYVYWTSLGQNEWQHTVSERFPGVITGTYVDYDSTGQARKLSWSGANSDTISYDRSAGDGYDSFGNLIRQSRAGNSETYTYDALQRLTQTSRTTGNIVSYGYSDGGNLTSKTDFGTGTYSYGVANSRTNGCGPHAVYAVGGTTYSCDANGNVTGGNALTLTFDANNQPRTAIRGSGSITWVYDANGERDYENDGTEHLFAGDDFRIEFPSNTYKHDLGPVVVTRDVYGNDTIAVVLHDRLGSTIDVIDNGTLSGREYDPFGKPRNGNMTDRSPATLNLTPDTIFGFTGHEHDDSVQLIHMKGRVFDYQLGRFLSVDPIIGNPLNSQSLNPYSYIGNNPLSGTDPTGYATCQASEVASTSECSQVGVHTIVGENGKNTTLVVGNPGDRIVFSGSGLNVSGLKDLSNGKLQLAYNPTNGADNFIKNGPSGPKDASSINSLADNGKGCAGGIACYDVHRNSVTGSVDSFERTFSVDKDYGAINGITNELGRAMELMAEHVSTRFGADNFVLAHNPTEGFWADIAETAWDKAGFTTAISQHFGEALAGVDHHVSWLAHSQGGEIFAEGARYALNHGASSLSNNTVAFDSGANNAWATNRILTRGGIQLFGKGYYDAPNDLVPQIVGLRGWNRPGNMARSLISAPSLFGPGSPHTHPQPNE